MSYILLGNVHNKNKYQLNLSERERLRDSMEKRLIFNEIYSEFEDYKDYSQIDGSLQKTERSKIWSNHK